MPRSLALLETRRQSVKNVPFRASLAVSLLTTFGLASFCEGEEDGGYVRMVAGLHLQPPGPASSACTLPAEFTIPLFKPERRLGASNLV